MIVLFESAVVVTLCILLWSLANKYVAMFLAMALVSQYYPFYGQSSYIAMHCILYGCILYGAIVALEYSNTSQVFMDMMCVVALGNIVIQALQVANMDPIFMPIEGGHDIPTGLMTNINETSALLAFCFPAFLRKRWVYMLPVVAFGFIAAKSSGGVMAVILGICAYAWMTGFASYVLIAISAFVVWWLVDPPYDQPGSASRIEVYIAGFKAYLQRPIMGFGIGHWKIVFQKPGMLPHYFSSAHNEFLQGLFEMGVAFGGIMAGYFIDIARRIKRDKRLHLPVMALVIVAANSLVNFPFHIAPTAAIAICWLAILEHELRQVRKDHT